jgi:hypothetical protein
MVAQQVPQQRPAHMRLSHVAEMSALFEALIRTARRNGLSVTIRPVGNKNRPPSGSAAAGRISKQESEQVTPPHP